MSSRVLCTSDCQSEKDSLRAEIARRDQEVNRLRIQQSEGSELERLRAIEQRAYECRTSGHLREVQAARYILTGKLEGETLQALQDTQN